ncbi:hypothetical protein L1887_03003 [Cichorium endivia]|nr:hypothetical protein L1887_03003 [Cichorium endivia]
MSSSQGLNTLTEIKTTPEDGSKFEEQEDQPLSPMARLFHEPGSNVYIISMMGSKTKINVDVVKKNLVHSLLRHPRFSSLQDLWKLDDNVRFMSHF